MNTQINNGLKFKSNLEKLTDLAELAAREGAESEMRSKALVATFKEIMREYREILADKKVSES